MRRTLALDLVQRPLFATCGFTLVSIESIACSSKRRDDVSVDVDPVLGQLGLAIRLNPDPRKILSEAQAKIRQANRRQPPTSRKSSPTRSADEAPKVIQLRS